MIQTYWFLPSSTLLHKNGNVMVFCRVSMPCEIINRAWHIPLPDSSGQVKLPVRLMDLSKHNFLLNFIWSDSKDVNFLWDGQVILKGYAKPWWTLLHTSICPLTRASSGGRGRSLLLPPRRLRRPPSFSSKSMSSSSLSAAEIKNTSMA